MAKAIVDPEELRRFARDLKRFNEQLESQMSTLQGRLHGLGQTWRDQEHTKFAEEFEQTMSVLKRFTESSNEHIPFLLKKAQHIENYLQQR
jgi:uncharacterized protein YukE